MLGISFTLFVYTVEFLAVDVSQKWSIVVITGNNDVNSSKSVLDL